MPPQDYAPTAGAFASPGAARPICVGIRFDVGNILPRVLVDEAAPTFYVPSEAFQSAEARESAYL